MSARHPLDGRLPPTLTREQRIALLHQAASDLLAGILPSPEAAAFLAAGVHAWLSEGGDLVRDYWKVGGEPGSHRTAQWVYRNLSSSAGQQESDNADTVSTSNTDEE